MTAPAIDDASNGDGRRLALSGDLVMAHAGDLARDLRSLAPGGTSLAVDLSRVDRIDTAGAWLVHRLVADWSAAGVPARVEGASSKADRLIAQVAANDRPVECHPPRRNRMVERLEKIGKGAATTAYSFGTFLAFLGQTVLLLFRTLIGRRPLRWHAVVHQCEQIGVNAIAIVGLLLFLVGITVAQQGAVQLRQFGADVFVVNLIGRATMRELGILLTAIMVAGRSASAFAAQIGSMKLNQEVDALDTIGLSPGEVLVVPRVIAMVLMLTLLSFFGSVMALAGGGLFVWVSLDIPPVSYIQRLREVIPISDMVIGLVKAPFFGFVIAVMGCFQGMQVTGNAESVGSRTTQAVVESIFIVIVLDAFFAIFFSALGYN